MIAGVEVETTVKVKVEKGSKQDDCSEENCQKEGNWKIDSTDEVENNDGKANNSEGETRKGVNVKKILTNTVKGDMTTG